jgi:hypothetical protein
MSGQGLLLVEWSSLSGGAPFHWSDEPESASLSLNYSAWHNVIVVHDVRFAGFGHARYFSGTLRVETWLQFIPLWFLAALFALAPTYSLLGPRRRQQQRRKLGLCERCGYDLRATPERCPECGTARPF